MVFLKNNPFVRLLIPLIVGILMQYKFNLPPYSHCIISFIGLIGFFLFVIFKTHFTKRYITGICIALFLFGLGAFITNFTNSKFESYTTPGKMIMAGTLTKVPENKDAYFKSEIEIEAKKTSSHWIEYHSKVIAYFKNDTNISKLYAGSKIIFHAQLKDIQELKNPFGFNYAEYLAMKQIDHSIYLDSSDWKLLTNKTSGLKYSALNFRQQIIRTFEKYGISEINAGVLSALTLGYKNKLDEKVRAAYSAAGAMHVLAVSGLHVGIIYLVLNFIFGWTKLFYKGNNIKYTFIILALWCYAFITGLSPSVMRATLMFSFIAFGQLLNKQINIYNSLAASAFLLLLINPFLLFEIGFQLSYIAVLGIVYFQPILTSWVYTKSKILNYVWSITAVSIAAQLSTFPITTYHFHQFPVYFWLSNIFVTHIALILIILTLILIAFSPFPIIAKGIAFIINKLVFLNTFLLDEINKLPASLISNITFSLVQVLIIMSCIIIFAIWLNSKKYIPLFISLCLLLALNVTFVINYYYRIQQNALCIYHYPKNTAIQFVDYKKSIWITNKVSNNTQLNRFINNGNLYWKTKQYSAFDLMTLNDSIIKNPNLYYNSGFWAFKDKKGLLIHSNSGCPLNPIDTLKLDYLIITGNPTFALKDLPSKIAYKKVIIDSSVPIWKTNNFRQNNTYEINNEGAFIVKNKI